MTPLPPGTHELALAPAVLALTVVHASQALGLRRALLEVGALAVYGYALERIGIGVFQAHDYGTAWRLAPGGVPVAVAAVWASVIVSALTLATRRGMATPGRRAATAALIAITLDLLIEPVAVRRGLWQWTPPGAWLGVPIGNFVGWGVVVAAWCLGAERDPFDAPLARVASRRAVLAAAAVAGLLLVGTAWQALGLERAFGAGAGWLVAAAVWLATLRLLGRRRPAGAWPDTLGGRLGATPGLAPELVMALLAAGFAVDASADGRSVQVVAAASIAVIGFVGVASGRFAFSDAWRLRALGRFAGVQDLVRVLMKPPNGQPWTEADRIVLRAELRALARLTPGFVLFLLPGGLVLLILYAHVLDRRRLKRPASDAAP